jgi:fructose-bisphosphate aldolase class II
MAFGAALRDAVNRDPDRFDRVTILKETHDPVFDGGARRSSGGSAQAGRA